MSARIRLEIEGDVAEVFQALLDLAGWRGAAEAERAPCDDEVPSRGERVSAERVAGPEEGDNAGTRTPTAAHVAAAGTKVAETCAAAPLPPQRRGRKPQEVFEPVAWDGHENKCPVCGHWYGKGAHRALCGARQRGGAHVCPKCGRAPQSRAHREKCLGETVATVAVVPTNEWAEVEARYHELVTAPDDADDVETVPPISIAAAVYDSFASNVAAGLVCARCGGRMLKDDDGPYCLAGHRPVRTIAEVEAEVAAVIAGGRKPRRPSHGKVRL